MLMRILALSMFSLKKLTVPNPFLSSIIVTVISNGWLTLVKKNSSNSSNSKNNLVVWVACQLSLPFEAVLWMAIARVCPILLRFHVLLHLISYLPRLNVMQARRRPRSSDFAGVAGPEGFATPETSCQLSRFASEATPRKKPKWRICGKRSPSAYGFSPSLTRIAFVPSPGRDEDVCLAVSFVQCRFVC